MSLFWFFLIVHIFIPFGWFFFKENRHCSHSGQATKYEHCLERKKRLNFFRQAWKKNLPSLYSERSPKPSPGLLFHFCIALLYDILQFGDIKLLIVVTQAQQTSRQGGRHRRLSLGQFFIQQMIISNSVRLSEHPRRGAAPARECCWEDAIRRAPWNTIPQPLLFKACKQESFKYANSWGNFIGLYSIWINSCAKRIVAQLLPRGGTESHQEKQHQLSGESTLMKTRSWGPREGNV